LSVAASDIYREPVLSIENKRKQIEKKEKKTNVEQNPIRTSVLGYY